MSKIFGFGLFYLTSLHCSKYFVWDVHFSLQLVNAKKINIGYDNVLVFLPTVYNFCDNPYQIILSLVIMLIKING